MSDRVQYWLNVRHNRPRKIVSGMEVAEHRAGMVIFQMLRDADGQLTTLEPYEVPVNEDAQAESPLLEAFVDSFQRALRGRAN